MKRSGNAGYTDSILCIWDGIYKVEGSPRAQGFTPALNYLRPALNLPEGNRPLENLGL